VPAGEIVKLLDGIALSFLVGNHDAHGKNYSLLYRSETSDAVLAPAYDVLSTFAYHKSHNLQRKMAMNIGGEYRLEYVRRRHLDRLLGEAGLGAAAARRRLRGHAAAAPPRPAALGLRWLPRAGMRRSSIAWWRSWRSAPDGWRASALDQRLRQVP
jgi:serine/threonine-protein kinase HipA